MLSHRGPDGCQLLVDALAAYAWTPPPLYSSVNSASAVSVHSSPAAPPPLQPVSILALLAEDPEDDEPVTNIADLDDDAWDELWESGEEESSESVFDIDDGWAVEDLDSQLDSPPRMDRIGRFDKQLRNVSKARKLAIPLTGRVGPSSHLSLTCTLRQWQGSVQRSPGCVHDMYPETGMSCAGNLGTTHTVHCSHQGILSVQEHACNAANTFDPSAACCAAPACPCPC